MKSTIALTLALSASAATPPPLSNSYCADVTETLTVDGVKDPLSTNAYNLCVDGVNMRWSQAELPLGSQYSIFNGTRFWTLFPDASLPGGYNCTYKISGPEPATDMPYRMIDVDAGADLNKTETYDGVKNAQNWYHFRPGSSSGHMQYAAQNQHWHIAAEGSDEKDSYLLATECIQVSQFSQYKGKLQHGVRDFSANRTKFVERALPKDVVCTEKPAGPHFSGSQFRTALYH